jgi:hypothetical protein
MTSSIVGSSLSSTLRSSRRSGVGSGFREELRIAQGFGQQ